MHLAANNGHASAVEYLLENGADMGSKKTDGGYPIHLASAEGHFKYAKY